MTQPSQDLQGRVAIVTGAGKGLGRAYALHLAARGAAVVVNNRRHPGEGDAQTSAAQTVATIVGAGGRATADWTDVSDPDSGRAMVEHARSTFGGIHIVVANAAVASASSFLKQDMAEFRRILDTGFFGTVYLAHAAWPHLLGQAYGRVILTTSSAGLYGDYGIAAYSASKAAIIGFARALALEGQGKGVLVNTIAPYAYSQMTAGHMAPETVQSFDPALVAPLVGWLASEACTVCGEVLVSGGGLVRRAITGETAAVAMESASLARQVQALRSAPVQSYSSARASFDRFELELQHHQEAGTP
ncbi:MAG: SDR family NAD(P)-dependent oxidoreductase [Rhodoferax sp.]|nr:SDR family NAD(P)-dependent oxidoreductase [Rhodoferax sp.]